MKNKKTGNRFTTMKTIQMVLTILLTVAGMIALFGNHELFTLMAENRGVRIFGLIFWVLIISSYAFLYYDFYSYSDLRRENMELDNAVYSDALTGIANRYSCDVFIGRYLNQPLPKNMGCVTIEMQNLAQLNENFGHTAGNEAILHFAEILQKAAAGECFIGRNGGNKFLAIFKECSEARLASFLTALEKSVDSYNNAHEDMSLSYCTGKAYDEGDAIHTLTELVALSDRRAVEAYRASQGR